jgi:SAM-dependent methyltransferase
MSLQPVAGTPAELVEYTQPELYDLENPDFGPDGAFYLELARRHPGAVLDLGCGTGRITIPLARAGARVTGLDAAGEMLAHARRKAGDLPITWVQADARSFQLAQRFELILDTGTTLQHLLDRADHEAMLACVRAHLAPGGRAVFHTFGPHPTTLVDRADEHDWFSYEGPGGHTVRVSGTIGYVHARQVFHEDAKRTWRDAGGQRLVHDAPLARRMFFPRELEALLHYNGFEVLEQFGSWQGEPIANDTSLIIMVCRAA